jgi:malate synthase
MKQWLSSLLHENFNPQRLELLENRKKKQALFDAGALPTFPAETHQRSGVQAAIPTDLLDRVEITGPESKNGY